MTYIQIPLNLIPKKLREDAALFAHISADGRSSFFAEKSPMLSTDDFKAAMGLQYKPVGPNSGIQTSAPGYRRLPDYCAALHRLEKGLGLKQSRDTGTYQKDPILGPISPPKVNCDLINDGDRVLAALKKSIHGKTVPYDETREIQPSIAIKPDLRKRLSTELFVAMEYAGRALLTYYRDYMGHPMITVSENNGVIKFTAYLEEDGQLNRIDIVMATERLESGMIVNKKFHIARNGRILSPNQWMKVLPHILEYLPHSTDYVPCRWELFDAQANGLIVFDHNKSKLGAAGKVYLNLLGDVLTAYPNIQLTITGHADSFGTGEHNKNLSRRRAEAVKAYLIKHGVKETRLEIQAVGEDAPVDKKDDGVRNIFNRNVELRVKVSDDEASDKDVVCNGPDGALLIGTRNDKCKPDSSCFGRTQGSGGIYR